MTIRSNFVFAAAISLLIPLLSFCQNSAIGFPADLTARFIPDVMNNVNVAEADGRGSYSGTVNLDSFPLFNGFPLHISGQSVEGGIVCNMDSDPDLEIVYCIGFTIQALNMDGSSVLGWPKTVSTYALEGAPAFGDIDNDGEGEIVATSHGLTSGGFIYAFKKDGTPVTGFPINHGYTTRTPVLADLDDDGAMEIIVNKRLSSAGEVWVYKGDGSVFPGWPRHMGHVPASSAAVGDITGDGAPEIIAESYTGLYAWHANGDSLPGFPFLMPNGAVNSYSSPVLADVDHDGNREIVFGTHVSTDGGYVFILKNDGSQLPNWPKATSQWIYGPPAVGYIDADTLLDIAVGDQVLSGTPSDYLYAWNSNGDALAGFPVGPLNAINNQVAVGDLDDDGKPELIVDDNTGAGLYLAFNHDGTPLSGWPITTIGTTFFNMPCLADVNRDGFLDIVGAGKEGTSSPFTNVYLWNTGIAYNANSIEVPVWQYNVAHNGVFDEPALVRVREREAQLPVGDRLLQNYPNPFNPVTIISYNVASVGAVSLNVYDLLGRRVASLFNGTQTQGSHSVTWDASGRPSGVYYYRLRTGTSSFTRRLMVLK
jgi:Secretion system C-terminal sorting domain/FG-GAP-like repeat